MMSSSTQASTSRQPIQKVPVELTTDLLGRFKPSKVFTDALERPSQPGNASPSQHQHGTNSLPQITSLDFDDTGEKCLTTGEDEGFVVWDMRKGRKLKQFWSKKYGVNLGRFTHRAGNIVHASTKAVDARTTLEDQHALRYHSTHDNKYLSYFKGHTARVRSLTMNPSDDTFLSAGDDATVRLWDLRMPECKGLLKDMGGSTVATFDNTGMVYAVACSDTQTLALYACQNMDTGPFAHTSLIDPALEEISSPPPKITVTSLHFSNNGTYLLVGTSSDVHYLYDAFDLHPIRRLTGHRPLAKSSGEELSFTADSRYVMSGSVEGAIYFWDLGKNQLDKAPKDDRGVLLAAKTLRADVVVQPTGLGVMGPSRAVKFNPRLCVMAVGGEELSFWLPAPDEEAKIEAGW